MTAKRFNRGDEVIVAGLGRSARAVVAEDWSGSGPVQVVPAGKTKTVPRDASKLRLAAAGPAAPVRTAPPRARRGTTKRPELRAVPKPAGPYRSRAYLDFVRSKPCMVARCAAKPPSDPHHWAGSRGMSQKVDDTRTVPLCRIHHDELHATGRLPGLDAIGTRIFLLDRQVALLTEYQRTSAPTMEPSA